MHMILLLYMIQIYTSSSTPLTWTLSPDLMPYNARSMVVGYDDINKKIWLLGGRDGSYVYHGKVLEFDVATENFIEHEALKDNDGMNVKLRSEAQTYTQIGDIIYMIIKDKFGTFNVLTQEFSLPWNNVMIPFTVSVDDGDSGYGCLTYIDNHLIVLGGAINEPYPAGRYSNMWIYDMIDDMWITTGPDMNFRRASFTCQVVDNYLYAIGGSYDWSATNAILHTDTVERIDVSDISNIGGQSWMTLTDTLTTVKGGIRSVVAGNIIYVFGGYTGTGWTLVVDIIETNNNDNIMKDSDLISGPNQPLAAVFADDSIFVFGGDTWQRSNAITSEPTIQTL
eukprot:197737_1